MKMGILPRGMWLLFHGSFEENLPLPDLEIPEN